MTVDAALRDLWARIGGLKEAVVGLRVTAGEDRPLDSQLFVADWWSNAADDLEGWADEALAWMAEALEGVRGRGDLNLARHALSGAHERLLRIMGAFSTELTAYPRLAELREVAQERGGHWVGWVDSLTKGLESCQAQLLEVQQGLLTAWLEISDMRSASVSSSVGPAAEAGAGGTKES